MATRTRAGTSVIEALAFLCELAMLAVLVIAGLGWNGSLGVRIAAAIVLPLLAILIWARWMAPTAKARLADPTRLIFQVGLFAVTGVLAIVAGRVVLGIVFALVAIVVFCLTRLGNGVTGGAANDG